MIPVRGTRPCEQKEKKSSLILDSTVTVWPGSLKRPHAGKSRRQCFWNTVVISYKKKKPSWSGGQTPVCWATLGRDTWGADSSKITTAGAFAASSTPAAEAVLHWVHYSPEWLWMQWFVLLGALCSAYQRAAQMKDLASRESGLHPPAEQKKMPHHVTDANYVWQLWFAMFYEENFYRIWMQRLNHGSVFSNKHANKGQSHGKVHSLFNASL